MQDGRKFRWGKDFGGLPFYNLFYILHIPERVFCLIWNEVNRGRDDWIRTSDLCVPNAALCQAELHPETKFSQ